MEKVKVIKEFRKIIFWMGEGKIKLENKKIIVEIKKRIIIEKIKNCLMKSIINHLGI